MDDPRPSSIDDLPPSVREALDGWLRDPSLSQNEATARTNALLADSGEWRGPPLTRHSVNRYSKNGNHAGEQLRQSRAAARSSSIDSLPAAVREALESWLRDPSVSQNEVTVRTNALLAGIDEWRGRPISLSAVGRYNRRMRGVGEKLRQSRAVADAWIAKMGSAPSGRLGHVVIEMLRTMVFDLTLRIHENELNADTMPAAAALIEKLSLSVSRLERSALETVKRDREVKRQAAEDLVRRIGEDASGAPVTTDRLREIVGEVYGVRG